MAVKIAPKAPQAAPVSGSANQPADARMIPGEKQYSVRAMKPPALQYSRRATYHRDAPSRTPNSSAGARANHPQYGNDCDCSEPGQNSSGRDASRYHNSE